MDNFNEFCYIKFVVFIGDSLTLLNLESSMGAQVLIRIAFKWVADFPWSKEYRKITTFCNTIIETGILASISSLIRHSVVVLWHLDWLDLFLLIDLLNLAQYPQNTSIYIKSSVCIGCQFGHLHNQWWVWV